MHSTIGSLASLSPNNRLFVVLREGDFENAAQDDEQSADVFSKLRAAVATYLDSSDLSGLESLANSGTFCQRAIVVGELTLAACALGEGRSAISQPFLEFACDALTDLGMIAEENCNSMSQAEIHHCSALREWASVLATRFETLRDAERIGQVHFIRCKITNSVFGEYPDLVGDAMVTVADAAQRTHRADLTKHFCAAVRDDLIQLVNLTNDPSLPKLEVQIALYWLQKACLHLVDLDAGDELATMQLRQVIAARGESVEQAFSSDVRYGPIARTYLSNQDWLYHVINDMIARMDRNENSDSIVRHCYFHWGCPSSESLFYLSAIGSYFGAKPLLDGIGVQTEYSQAHKDVFAAIESNGFTQ